MSSDIARILVVDHDPVSGAAIASVLSAAGYDAWAVTSDDDAFAAIDDSNAKAPAVAVIDVSSPELGGLDFIRRIARCDPAPVPVAVTAYGSIESAVETIRLGAIEYLLKPLVDEELLVAVERAVQHHALVSANAHLRAQLEDRFGLDNIIGNDPRMRRIYKTIEAVAATKTTVLMSGESGTGKSLIARAIHRRSPRADRPFVEVACGSIPETLLESELFGHVRGAFTGAHADKKGRFLAAHGGTIFLDEINSASPAMQLKLLRVLQERRFEPVGSSETVEVDVRVVLAGNQPLEDLVARGEFRQDLYYRINVIMIQLPPLRERAGDIAILADHFLQRHAREAGREMLGLTSDAINALCRYAFPGNVRELENMMERAVVLSRSPRVDVEDLPQHVVADARPPAGAGGMRLRIDAWRPMSLADALREPEKQIILAALNAHDWNRQETADALAINRSTLYKKMKQYGLDEYGQTG